MKAAIGAAILAASLAPSNLSAQADFTFTVPVEVNALDSSISNPMVACEALTADGQRVRNGTAEIPVDAGGSYTGQVVVEATHDQFGRSPEDAEGYECYFYMRVGNTYYPAIGPDAMNPTTPEEALPKPDSPATLLVEGPIP